MGAKIIRHGPWNGPGEETTAVYLRDHLDDRWTVVCGRQLVAGSGTRDSDFIVIGPSSVTVIEEKAWAVDLVGTEERWYVRRTREERGSPINQVAGVARVLAGNLTKHNASLRQALKDAAPSRGQQLHLVHSLVVMSSPEAKWEIADPRASQVVPLVGCERSLLEIDRSVGARFDLAPFRDAVLAVVSGLPERPVAPATLGPYTIVGEIEPTALGRRWVGRHPGGETRVLMTYERQGLTALERQASDNQVLREYRALQKLAPLRRVFAVDPYFDANDTQAWVIPMHPPEPSLKTLRVLIRAGVQPSAATFAAVAADAFAGLADIHAEGITHRGLHPSRIWLDPATNRVTFSDFLVAKIQGTATIVGLEDLDPDGRPFRAPECRNNGHVAIDASDVYALAQCLLSWWELRQSDPSSTPRVPAALPDAVRGALEDALADDPVARPDARTLADRLASHLHEEKRREVRPRPGAKIGKYEIVEQLGDGATATTWKLVDRAFDLFYTLKIMKSPALLDNLRSEFQVLSSLKHPRIVRIVDYRMEPPGPALIAEFVDGQTVATLWPDLEGNVKACRRIAADVLDALRYLHDKDVVHRDLSPNNIIVGPDDHATLIDFGVASRRVDAAQTIVGTLPYQAPEIAADGSWSASADLYSLAVLLFEALTARLPYVDIPGRPNKYELVPPTPKENTRCGDAGAAFLEVLLRGADPDPKRRPASAAAFLDALELAFAPPAAPVLDSAATIVLPGRTPPRPRTRVINPRVDDIRQLFRNSRLGNSGNRGLDSPFAERTYIPTRLDDRLLPRIIEGRPRLVVFSGNPGDGKTAFLERVGAEVLARGAAERHRDPSGWRIMLDGHEFASVYDASESHEGISADDLLRRVLDPLNDPVRAGQYTALIAANDGRLLDFLDREHDRYPQIAKLGLEGAAAARDPNFLRIDLKRRAMASLRSSDGSLTVRMLDALLADDLWEPCGTCAAEPRCPIIANARQLREPRAQDRLHRLVLTSHLRRGRRPTIRDLRSALAYLVTVDLGCADVHAELGDGLGNPARAERHFTQAAFDADAGRDRLLDEWRALDPAGVAAPGIERRLAPSASSARDIARAKRRFYFTADDGALAGADFLGPYRYLDHFRSLLGSAESPTGPFTRTMALPRLLRGLSRCVGPVGYDDDGVAVLVGEPSEDGGAVVKVLEPREFELVTESVDDEFVEASLDLVVLRHTRGQARLVIDIDLFELLMRAADGFVPTSPEVAPLLEELGLFRSALTLEPASRVLVLEPNGRRNPIAVNGTTIELLGGAR